MSDSFICSNHSIVVMKTSDLLSGVYVLAENLDGFAPENVETYFEPKVFKLPDELECRVPEIRSSLESKGGYDGDQCRLDQLRLDSYKIKDDALKMYFSMIKFSQIMASNAMLNRMLESGLTVREKYIVDPRRLDDQLANSTSTATSIITNDDKIVFKKRSDDLVIFPGEHSHPVAGFLERDSCMLNGVPNPFLNMKHEVKEELGVEIGMSDYKVHSIIRNEPQLRVEIIGKVRVPFSEMDIRNFPKKEPEGEYVFIDFKVDDVLRTLLNKQWTNGGKYGAYLALVSEFGSERVEKSLENF